MDSYQCDVCLEQCIDKSDLILLEGLHICYILANIKPVFNHDPQIKICPGCNSSLQQIQECIDIVQNSDEAIRSREPGEVQNLALSKAKEEDEGLSSSENGTSDSPTNKTQSKSRRNNLIWKPQPQNAVDQKESYCQICDKTYYDKYELRQHNDRIHRLKTYVCSFSDCKKAFATSYLRTRHLRLTHSVVVKRSTEKVQSENDQSDSKDNTTLVESSEKKYGIPRIRTPTCCLCQATFTSEHLLSEHVKTSHIPPEKKKFSHECRFECSYCLRKFQRKGAYYRHFLDPNFIEEVKFYDRHKKSAKLSEGAMCQMCGKILRSQYDLKMHEQRVHTENRPFKCNFKDCNASFTAETYLKEHRKHHGVKGHICEVCGFAFHRISKLNEHLKLHADGKLIKCTKCIKMYRTKAEFEAHFAKHVANQCTLCEKAYTKREYLNRHMKTVHGGLPDTTCTKCGRKFVHPGYYREHEDKCDGVFKPYKPKKKRAKPNLEVPAPKITIKSEPHVTPAVKLGQ